MALYGPSYGAFHKFFLALDEVFEVLFNADATFAKAVYFHVIRKVTKKVFFPSIVPVNFTDVFLHLIA